MPPADSAKRSNRHWHLRGRSLSGCSQLFHCASPASRPPLSPARSMCGSPRCNPSIPQSQCGHHHLRRAVTHGRPRSLRAAPRPLHIDCSHGKQPPKHKLQEDWLLHLGGGDHRHFFDARAMRDGFASEGRATPVRDFSIRCHILMCLSFT